MQHTYKLFIILILLQISFALKHAAHKAKIQKMSLHEELKEDEQAEITPLINGLTATGSVLLGAYATYSFKITPFFWNNEMKINLVAYDGTAELFLGMNFVPNNTFDDWKVVGDAASKFIRIDPSDPKYKVGDIYIAIYGKLRCNYEITVTVGELADTLENGLPLEGAVVGKGYTWYAFKVSDFFATQNLNIYVLNLEGDADLYVSFKTSRPSNTEWTWGHSGAGPDNLTIDSTDQNYHAGTLYIALYGFSSVGCRFIITVTCDPTGLFIDGVLILTSTEIPLVNGLPETGSVDLQALTFYKFEVTDYINNQTLQIRSRITEFGHVYLFASQRTSRPSPSVYTWSSTTASASQSIIIHPDDVNFKKGIMYVGVYGQKRSLYDITVLTPAGGVTVLENGFPVKNVLIKAREWKYYEYTLTEFTISKTCSIEVSENNLQLVLYASFQTSRPGPKSYQWTTPGQNIIIEPDDPKMKQGPLYVAVYAITSTNFSITATSGVKVDTLYNSTETLGQLLEGQFNYYQINIADPFTIVRIFVTSTLGLNSVYASQKTSRPGLDSYTWSSTGTAQTKVITILPTDTNFGAGTLYVSIFGQTTSKYSLLVQLSSV